MRCLFVCNPKEQPCVSVPNDADCARGARRALGEGWLESSEPYSVLRAAGDTVPSLQHAQTQRGSCTAGSLPTAKETKPRENQRQGKSEKS